MTSEAKSNVTPVFGGPVAKEPNQDVIDILQKWLDQAKAGDLRAISIAGVLNTGFVQGGYKYEYGTEIPLAGAIMYATGLFNRNYINREKN